MSADQLAVDGFERIGNIETAFFGGHLCEENGLEQKMAEFLGQPIPIAGIDGVEDFVGFLQEIGLDCVEIRFAVPRAAAGGAEARHDLEEPRKAGSGGQFGLWSWQGK